MILNRCFMFCYITAAVNICTKITDAYGSKILIINHVTLPSNLHLFSGVLEELVSRGHNVTYFGVLPYTGYLKSKITQHPLASKIISNRSSVLRMMQDAIDPSTSPSYFSTIVTFIKLHGKEPCTYLESDMITKIMNSSVTFDVLILNACLAECFYSIGYMKGIPIILISASLPFPWQYTSIGIDPYFGIEKSILLHYPRNNFIHRTLDILVGNFLMMYRYWMYASATDVWLAKNYPNINFPPFHRLEKNISLLMVNSIPAMGYARSESPLVINIGGIHVRQPKKLPNELENFISASKTGFIYLSFGSSFQTSIVPKSLLNIFIEAFKKLPYRILIKWNDNSTSMPSNVLSSPWHI